MITGPTGIRQGRAKTSRIRLKPRYSGGNHGIPVSSGESLVARRIVWVFALGLCIFAAGRTRADEKANLQGAWLVEKGIEDGVEMPAKEREKLKVEFKGDKILLYEDKMVETDGFRLDADKSPKAIDVIPEKKDEKPLLGIYQLEGDILKLCFSHQGQKRPGEFASTKESGTLLLYLKRVNK